MRVLHAAVLTMAALFFASITSAQGLGGAAAREKERRNATPDKPAKVYTDKDIATAPDPGPAPAAEGEGKTGDAKSGDKKQTDEEKAAAEKDKARTDWRNRMDQARRASLDLEETINSLNKELGDQSALSYGPQRAAKLTQLEEAKKKLAETQANLATLQEEGRRNGY
jgi:hypothetical protein